MPIKPAMYRILIVCGDQNDGALVTALFKALGFSNCVVKSNVEPEDEPLFEMILLVSATNSSASHAHFFSPKMFMIGNSDFPRPFSSSTIIKLMREYEKRARGAKAV